MKYTFQLYVFSLPFVSAFAITGTVTLSVLLACVLFFGLVNRWIANDIRFDGINDIAYLFVFLFLSCVGASYVLNGLAVTKSFNHLIAYNTSIILFLAMVSLVLPYLDVTSAKHKIFRMLYAVCIISATFCVLEFIIKNTAGLDINDYLPRPDVKEFGALAISEFFRARGFAEEPGHFALFLELFTPVCIYYLFFSGHCRLPSVAKWSSVVIMMMAWLFTVSTASFLIVPLSYFMGIILNIWRLKRKAGLLKKLGIVLLSVGLFGVLLNLFLPVTDIFYYSIIEKFDSFSMEDRQARIAFFEEYFAKGNIFNLLLGNGPAAYDILGFDDTHAILSLYISVLFETGILGLLSLVLFLLVIFSRLMRMEARQSVFFTAAFFAGLMHYNFVSNYWFPWIWFLFALILYFSPKAVPSGPLKVSPAG